MKTIMMMAAALGVSVPNPSRYTISEHAARTLEEALNEPVHGKHGWELARYEWCDGIGTFHYVRNTGERRTVARTQSKYAVGGVK